MSWADTRDELAKAGICKQTGWQTVHREMNKSLEETVKKEKPVTSSKKNQLALKAWKQREEAAKLKFITEASFSSQRTARVSVEPSEVERFLTFLYWKTTKDMSRKGKPGSDEDKDEDNAED